MVSPTCSFFFRLFRKETPFYEKITFSILIALRTLMAFSRSSSSSFIRSSGPNQLLLVSAAELLRRLLWRLVRTLSMVVVGSRAGRVTSEALKPRTREVGTREPRKRCNFVIFSLLCRRSSSGVRRYSMESRSAESNELSWGEDGKECGEKKGMGRLSSSLGSIITSETAPVLLSPALPPSAVSVPANDSSEMENASMGLGKTKRS
jgi:hypothetical protein